jgi:fructose-1,6-bisphosphatase/inositol monophosphatase family enzyme
MDATMLDKARVLLCRMQECIRDRVLEARRRQGLKLAGIAAVTSADTIYKIDRVSEAAILQWFEEHWPKQWPVELVMEGLEDLAEPTTFPIGTPVAKTLFKCIIDPIDGTRNLMYDKRSAWVLTGLAPQRGARNHLGDLQVAVMTEIPTSRQTRSDQFSAVRGGPLKANAQDLKDGRRRRIRAQPSASRHYEHGFASIVRFFPEGMELLARFEEQLWAELYGREKGKSPVIFSDQYISTGGQLFEILAGHDRMIADLRPLAFERLGLKNELVCHPYDICTALLLEAAGCVIEHPHGKPLRAPLDTTSPVSWVAYANPQLAKLTRPLMRRLCRELLA